MLHFFISIAYCSCLALYQDCIVCLLSPVVGHKTNVLCGYECTRSYVAKSPYCLNEKNGKVLLTNFLFYYLMVLLQLYIAHAPSGRGSSHVTYLIERVMLREKNTPFCYSRTDYYLCRSINHSFLFLS